MAFSIGAREFDDLQGVIETPTRKHDVETRSGQDGSVVFSVGQHGVPFGLDSMFVCASYADAHALEIVYANDPSLTPLNIVRGSTTYAATSIRFIVLGVKVTSIKPLIAWSGPRGNLSPAFAVYARWTLQAVIV